MGAVRNRDQEVGTVAATTLYGAESAFIPHLKIEMWDTQIFGEK